MKQKNEKKFLNLMIIAFESATSKSHNPEQDTCHWQSMCYETSLRFNMSLKRDIFQIKFLQINEKILRKCSHEDFTRVWDPLTCWLSRGVQKRCFLESGLSKSFIVCNFRNKVAMTIIFFSKCLKFDVDFKNRTKQW